MANNPFVKAVKTQAKLRLAIDGPTGAGKTYTALVAATALAEGGKIALIDTERNSASLYSDKFDFDVVALDNFSPKNYIDMIEAAHEAKYAVIVIDSLSHAWEGEGGALDMVDAATKRSQSGNSYTAWKDVTPLHRRMIDAMLQSSCHVIVTMRSKMEYALEREEKTGKTIVRKLGLAPIQRQGMEYEFTIVCDMDIDHNLVVTKSRMDTLADQVVNKPDAKFFKRVLDWLNAGVPAQKPAPQPTSEPPMNGRASRPYDAVTLASKLAEKIQNMHANTTCTDNERNMIAVNINLMFAGQSEVDKVRHSVLKYLTGKTSVKDLIPQQVKALKAWINSQPDSGGEWQPDPLATKEAQSVWTAALEGAGQEKLL